MTEAEIIPDELMQLAEKIAGDVYRAYHDDDGDLGLGDAWEIVARALQAAADAQREREVVTVVPLNWDERYDGPDFRGNGTVIATTPIGEYQVFGDGTWRGTDGYHRVPEGTMEAGQKAAENAHVKLVESLLSRKGSPLA